jgi:hypothetical protein
MPYVAGCEDAWRAGFLKHRRPVQRPAIKIKPSKQEASGIALQASSKPIRVRIGADEDEQCCGWLGSFAAGCQVTHSKASSRPWPSTLPTAVLSQTLILAARSSSLIKYADMRSDSDGPRTTSVTCEAKRARWTAACPPSSHHRQRTRAGPPLQPPR